MKESPTPPDVMGHFSTPYYIFEGLKEDKVHYRCRCCREHLIIPITSRPEAVHGPKCPRLQKPY
jgi:hypothetical protein